MWVVCCGMLRSGSTLQYNITSALVERAGAGEAAGFFEATAALKALPDQNPDWIYVYKVHDFDPLFVRLRRKVRLRLVYCYRDLRDVLASWMEMQNLTFEQANPRALLRQQVVNMAAWTAQPKCLVQPYERDLVSDLTPAVRAIARHIGFAPDEAGCQAVSQAFSPPAQQTRIRTFDYDHQGIQASGLHTRIHPGTLLHDRHILNGRHGRWQSVLSPEQCADIELWFGDWLRQHGYLPGGRASLFQRLRQRLHRHYSSDKL